MPKACMPQAWMQAAEQMAHRKRFNSNVLFSRNDRPRRAAAVVELSVCLPLLVFIALATIEACAMIYLKQSLKIAAYESSRVGVVEGAESTNVIAQADLILATRNVSGYAIAMLPSDPGSLQSGDYFRVSVSAPCVANSLIGGWFFQSKTLTEFVEVQKE